jgi:hypothetical protein
MPGMWGSLLSCSGLKTRHWGRAQRAPPIGAQDFILPNRLPETPTGKVIPGGV